MSEFVCWRCGETIPPGAKFDLIHASGRNRPVHASGEGCSTVGAALVHLAADDREHVLCTGEPWPTSGGEHQPGTLVKQCPDCFHLYQVALRTEGVDSRGWDLVSRVRDRLDQWEAAANEAFDGPWPIVPAAVKRLAVNLRASLDRHRPCHGPDTDPWASSCGHWLADSGLPDPDETPYCLWCTYDDRTVPAPCPDLLALACAVGIPVEEADR